MLSWQGEVRTAIERTGFLDDRDEIDVCGGRTMDRAARKPVTFSVMRGGHFEYLPSPALTFPPGPTPVPSGCVHEAPFRAGAARACSAGGH